jgi:hypothetical protein
MRSLLYAAFAGCVALQVVRYALTRTLVAGDSAYYYSAARSLLVDHNLDISWEYQFFRGDVSPRSGNRRLTAPAEVDSVTRRIANPYQIGTSLAILPFMAAVRPFAKGDGFGRAYMLAAGFGSAAIAFVGLLLLYRAGAARFGPDRALLATLAIWLATPLVYYMTIEPLMSHAVSMGAVSALLVCWLMWRDNPTPGRWAILGLCAGLAALVRYQDVLFAAVPVIDAWASGAWRRDRRRTSLSLVAFVLCAGLVGSAQLYANVYYRGSMWATGYPALSELHWITPAIGTTLFSLHDGLFVYAPVTLLALFGLYHFTRVERVAGGVLVGALVAQVYVTSAWLVPEQGAAFGNRMLLSCTPIFGVGLMSALDQRRYRVICVALIVVNAIVAGLYCARIIPDPFIAAT